MFENKKLLRDFRKLLIKSEKWTIRIKKLEYKIHLLDYIRISAMTKTMDFKEIEKMNEIPIPKDKIHI